MASTATDTTDNNKQGLDVPTKKVKKKSNFRVRTTSLEAFIEKIEHNIPALKL